MTANVTGTSLRPFCSPAEHLRAELARLDLELAAGVHRRRAGGLYAGDPAYRGLYIPEDLIDALINGSVHEPGGDAELDVFAMRADIAERIAITPADRLPLMALAAEFGLSGLDVDIVVLAAAVEVDQRYATLVAWLQDDVALRRPTVALAADLWSDPYAIRSHVGPDGVLRKCGLVDVRAADGPVRPSLLDHALMLPDRVLSHLLGDDEPRSEWLTRERVARDVDQLTHQPLTAAALSRAALASVVVLTGAPGRGRRTTALALAGTEEVVVFDGDIAEGTLDDAVLEARISRSPLVITDADVLAERVGGHHVVVAVQTLSVAGHRVLLTSATSWHHAIDAAADWHDVELPEPAYRERVLLWREALVGAGLDVDPDEIATVADTYVLGPAQIHAAANSAADLRECDADALSRAARARSTHSLARLARQVDTPYTWKDLVLPARTTKLLDEIVSAVRHRPRVQQEWQMTRRRGMAILFSGPSGTGKTMSASLIAAELRVDLFAVDLAAVVSKYIGETEKNLDAVFTEARSSNAMLLFDEADALFGRRSETKDAHDRYANLEVAYLLQRMEAYDGLTVLTTNLRTNVDEAFARRFAFTVDFPPPDAGMRARIWRVAIPLHVPLADDVDLDQLADWIDLTGSGIANSALAAAYLAAAEDEPIAMQHLVRGVGRELQKSGRTPSRAAFGSYYRYLIEPSEVAESPSAAP